MCDFAFLSKQMHMLCHEKARLLQTYQEMTAKYAQAVTKLNELRATSPIKEYKRPNDLAEQARLQSAQARLDLEKHIHEHKC